MLFVDLIHISLCCLLCFLDFMKDCNVPAKNEIAQTNGKKAVVTNSSSEEGKIDIKTVTSEPVKKTVKEIFEFAGEKIE